MIVIVIWSAVLVQRHLVPRQGNGALRAGTLNGYQPLQDNKQKNSRDKTLITYLTNCHDSNLRLLKCVTLSGLWPDTKQEACPGNLP